MPEMATAGEYTHTTVSKVSAVIQGSWIQLSFQKVALGRRRASLNEAAPTLLSYTTLRLGVGACICKEVTVTYFPSMLWGLSSTAAGSPSILFAVQQRFRARAA